MKILITPQATSLPGLDVITLFCFCHPSGWVLASHCRFHLHFPDNSAIEHLFMYRSSDFIILSCTEVLAVNNYLYWWICFCLFHHYKLPTIKFNNSWKAEKWETGFWSLVAKWRSWTITFRWMILGKSIKLPKSQSPIF